MRALAIVAAAVLVMAYPAAHATPITYDFTGTVTAEASQPVSVGQQIAIAVTVDPLFPAIQSAPGVTVYNGGFVSPSPVLSATFDGQNVLGSFSSVVIHSDAAGISSMAINSGTPETDAGFSLSFQAGAPGVLASGAMPLAIDPLDFQTGTFRRTVALNYLYYAGTINRPQAVPSPGSLALLGSGLTLLILCRPRRSPRP